MNDVAKTPREELECEKKYLYEYSMFWECNEGSKCQILEEDVCDLLNELNKDNEELEISIKLFEDDIATKDKKIEEQQANINELQSIIKHIKCEENCFDYDYCCETVCSLSNEIKHLKEENEQLSKEHQEMLEKYVLLRLKIGEILNDE